MNGERVRFDLYKGYHPKDGSTIYRIHHGEDEIAVACLEWGGDRYVVQYDGPTRNGTHLSCVVVGGKPMRNITSVMRKVADIWGTAQP